MERWRRRGPAAATAAVPAVTALVYVALGWMRRWTVDDAFINYRVVKQIQAGNGPVFNVGERVEAATSSLWLVLLTVGDLLSPLRMEWTALLMELGFGVLGVVAGMAGARRLGRLRGAPPDGPGRAGPPGRPAAARLVVPLGAVAFLAVAATWDWATGGLENGLALGWLGTTFWAVADLAGRPSPSSRRLLWVAVLAGLGVLVRPDFLPFCAGFLTPVGWLAGRRTGRRGVVEVAAAAAALPAVVQVFRMGYYGQLLPNTVYAKEGVRSWWSQGWDYLDNFAAPYLLAIPAALTLAWLVLSRRESTSAWRLIVVSLELAVLTHALAIVRVGGDYMHGRLLHPTWFALLLPIFAVPLPEMRTRWRAVIGLGILGWAAVAAVAWRAPVGTFVNEDGDVVAESPTVGERGDAPGVIDGRELTRWQALPGGHMVVVQDMWAYQVAGRLEEAARAGPGYRQSPGDVPVPLRPELGADVVVGQAAVGAIGYAAPLDTWIYDRHGLGDAVVARVRLDRRATPGHEKMLGAAWVAAQFVNPGTEVDPARFASIGPTGMLIGVDVASDLDPAGFAAERAAAERALGCGELAEIVDNVRSRLTPGRFLGNLVDAVRLHHFRFPSDPREAEEELCGG